MLERTLGTMRTSRTIKETVGLARQKQKQSGSWKQFRILHIQVAALRPNMRNFAVRSAAPLLLCQLWPVGGKSCHIQVNAPPFLPGGFFDSLHYCIPPPSSQRLQKKTTNTFGNETNFGSGTEHNSEARNESAGVGLRDCFWSRNPRPIQASEMEADVQHIIVI